MGQLRDKLREHARRCHEPASVTLELTYRCNHQCDFCYVRSNGDGRELDAPAWARILEALKAAGCTSVLVTGGEPFLHPACLDVLRRANELGLLTQLYTNGSLIGPTTAAELGALNLLEIGITLYGANAPAHDRYTRCPGSFERVTRGVRLLRDAGCRVRLRWYALPPSVGRTGAFIDLAESLGVERQASGVVTARRDGTVPDRVSDAELSRFYRTIVGRFYDDDGLLAEARRIAAALDRNAGPDTLMCGAGQASGRISPAGVLYPCIEIHEPLGDLTAVPFAEAWERSRSVARTLRLADFPTCRSCRYFWACDACPGAFRTETDAWGFTPREQCRNTVLRIAAVRRCVDERIGAESNPLTVHMDQDPLLMEAIADGRQCAAANR